MGEQLSIFDDGAKPEKSNASPTGRQLRDRGMRRAVEHADQTSPAWSECALGYFREYAVDHVEFATEDVRGYAEARGFALPPDKRSWGHVARSAARQRIVRAIGFTKARSPSVHCMTVTLWTSRGLG